MALCWILPNPRPKPAGKLRSRTCCPHQVLSQLCAVPAADILSPVSADVRIYAYSGSTTRLLSLACQTWRGSLPADEQPLILQQPKSKSTCSSLLPEGFPFNPNESTLLQETCEVQFGSCILFIPALLFCLHLLRSA